MLPAGQRYSFNTKNIKLLSLVKVRDASHSSQLLPWSPVNERMRKWMNESLRCESLVTLSCLCWTDWAALHVLCFMNVAGVVCDLQLLEDTLSGSHAEGSLTLRQQHPWATVSESLYAQMSWNASAECPDISKRKYYYPSTAAPWTSGAAVLK